MIYGHVDLRTFGRPAHFVLLAESVSSFTGISSVLIICSPKL